MKKLFYILGLLIVLSNFCVIAQDRTQTFKIDSITGDFTARVTLIANDEVVDASFGLGPVALTGWSDFNAIVRFSPTGVIDVRNGGSYAADSSLRYVVGKPYYIQIKGNIDDQKYSVIVTPEGGEMVKLATDYAFRANNYKGYLHYASQRAVLGSLTVTDFQIGVNTPEADHDNFYVKLDNTLKGDFSVKFRATPSSLPMNGAIGLSKIPVLGWADYNAIITFANDSTIKVRDGGSYKADEKLYYEAGKQYTFYIYGNTDSTKYSVLLVKANGEMVQLATNYGFRLSKPGDELNYIAQRMVHSVASGGTPDSYIYFDGIEHGGKIDIDNVTKVVAISQEIMPITGIYSKSFTATPSEDNIDATISFNETSNVGWADLSAIIRFNPNGIIDVRNGGSYSADTAYNYKASQTYVFDVDFDVDQNSYSVFVKSDVGAEPVVLATNYAFRKQPVSELKYITFKGRANLGFLTYSEVAIGNTIFTEIPTIAECVSPTINDIENIDVESGFGEYSVDLSGITDGGDEISQIVAVTAFSSAPDVVSNPVISALAADGTALMKFNIAEVDANTTVTVTVIVSDDCDVVSKGGMASLTKVFNVNITAKVGVNTMNTVKTSIYPNPANNYIIIESLDETITKVEVLSIKGEKVMEIGKNGLNLNKVDITELNPGIYFIKGLNGNSVISTGRFIKQ
jgi:hypothetical protein